MRYRIKTYIVISIILALVLSTIVISIAQQNQPVTTEELNNIALCYHGITASESEKAKYVTYFEDFKEQINHLKNNGYIFVSPSKYNEWYSGKYNPPTPIATVMFDDARESVEIAARWLIESNIPFGVAVIGRRLRVIEAEQGYMDWSTLKSIYDSGYCEVLNHSYNMHHFALTNDQGSIVSAPILEGPYYVDNGEFVYIDKDDTRPYWDLSHVDGATWAFPLFGTDAGTGEPITSTVKFKATKNIAVSKMRLWASLHSPYSSGYDVNIKIDINGIEVANKIVNPQQYKTHSQWLEREFVTIDFDKPYDIEAGESYTITFTTIDTGTAAFQIYSIPDFSGEYELSTTSTGKTYKALEKWPARAAIILADENGKQVTEKDFEQYVYDDLHMNNTVIQKYLSASWEAISTGFMDDGKLECLVLGGTYSDGSAANTSIKFTPDKTFASEVIRFRNAPHLGQWYPLILEMYINDKKAARFSPNWKDWSWQTVGITPYEFVEGKEYNITFKTLNTSSSGQGLVRILLDQQDLPWPKWDHENNGWIQPEDWQFQHTPAYETNSLEGSDVYPDGINIDNHEYSWEYSAPYTGPGRPFLEMLTSEPQKNIEPTQVCYPFGSYYSQITGNNKEDVHGIIKNILSKINIESGYAVWDEEIRSMENIQSQYSEFVIPRYLVEGDLELDQIINDINVLTGIK